MSKYVWSQRIVWSDGSIHCNDYDGVNISAEAYKLEEQGYIPGEDYHIENVLVEESVVYGY